jgi:alpha-aminoadipate carrier protein LysW
MMSNVFCPDCDGEIIFNPHPRIGQKLTCPHCASDLEVVSIDPVELDWAYDWSDDDDWADWDDDGDDDY